MKAEILKILQLQEEGKLTREQAAELLAILADQAREKTGETAATSEGHNPPSEGSGGASGPRVAGSGAEGESDRSFAFSSAAAIHDLVDTAIGMGATIGRAASVFGGEVVNMVYRQEGGNAVTLSKVEAPTGEDYAFNGNTINVSKISDITLRQAQVRGNTINASKMAHLAITRGRFSQCNISGSSVSHVSITGPAAEAPPPASPTPQSSSTTSAAAAAPAETAAAPSATTTALVPTGIRGVTFNASKFSRINVEGVSALEVCTIQAAAVKDWSLVGSTLRDSKINDAHVAGLSLEDAAVTGLLIERSSVQSFKLRKATLDKASFISLRVSDVTISGGQWTDVKFRREAGGTMRECLLSETLFENCELAACEFVGCTFRRTTLRNVKLAGITVRNVDFTGMTLESEADFRRAAGI
jgi:uncharacterized protein YjbI with pentapeptide repeats